MSGHSLSTRSIGILFTVLGLSVLSGCLLLLPPGLFGADPPGIILIGAGPVLSRKEARLRVLRDYLDIQNLDLAAVGQRVTGDGDAPLYDVYELPGGPFRTGSVVDSPFADVPPVTLNADYYVFWVDPNPLADLGHLSYGVYVRMRDGQMFVQTVEFAPRIDGVEHLLFDDDRAANLIYRHAALAQLFEGQPAAQRPRKPRAGAMQAKDATIAGLAVGGAPEQRRLFDLGLAAMLYEGMGGPPGGLDFLQDRKDDRINKDELAEALRKASEGLGKCDKFFFFISSHGSKDGQVRIGQDVVPWEEICRLLAENVQAEFINCVFATCYAGTAILEFLPWITETTSGIRVVTTTDSGHPTYSAPEGNEFNLECVVAKIEELLAASAGDSAPTLEQIEAAFQMVDISQEDLDKKMCDFIDAQKAASPDEAAELDDFKDNYLSDDGPDDPIPPTGTPDTGGFPPADPAPPVGGGFMPLFPLLPGTGTTNDGGGQFDLSGGTLVFGVAPNTVTLSSAMQVTNIPDKEPGSFEVTGTTDSAIDGSQVIYAVTGMMQVFPGAQMESLTGTITLGFLTPTLTIDFVGTHTQGQQAVFHLSALLAPRGGPKGDFDLDGDVDLFDVEVFVGCLVEAASRVPPILGYCAPGDFDGDGDLDTADRDAFLNALSGP